MIVTHLPDVPPRPETPRNAAFRRYFYSRLGRENCIICGPARRAEYMRFKQTLSIKMVMHGREHYYVDQRRLTVTDETWLLLNEGREYASLLEALPDTQDDAFTFSIFFRPGIASELAGAAKLNLGRALDAGDVHQPAAVEFGENLRRNDKIVSPVLNYIRRHVALGIDDQGWYDEQCDFLVLRMLRNEHDLMQAPERIDCVGAAKRSELMRRLGWATDFMHSNLQRELTLADIARAARLSQYHFLRVFRQAHGVTPMTYLRTQRTQRALALLQTTSLDVSDIAAQVGLSRLSLWRHLRSTRGEAPRHVRERSRSTSRRSLAEIDHVEP